MMEKLRKFYLPIVHFICLGLLIYILTSSPFYVEFEKGVTQEEIDKREKTHEVYFPEANNWLILNMRNKLSGWKDATVSNANLFASALQSDLETERQNRALIVYTILAMYLGSGYLLFKKS